jgi:hypothetical protein
MHATRDKSDDIQDDLTFIKKIYKLIKFYERSILDNIEEKNDAENSKEQAILKVLQNKYENYETFFEEDRKLADTYFQEYPDEVHFSRLRAYLYDHTIKKVFPIGSKTLGQGAYGKVKSSGE